MLQRFISALIRVYPSLSHYLADDMNFEETVIFNAKIKRLETEKEIYSKCLKGEYSNEWIWNFRDYPSGREFASRYKCYVRTMFAKFEAKIEKFDFQQLAQITFDLFEECQQYHKKRRETLNKLDDDSFDTWNSDFLKNQVYTQEEPEVVSKISDIVDRIYAVDRNAGYFLLYLMGDTSKKTILSSMTNMKEFHQTQQNYRFFVCRKMMRYYDWLPLVVTYIYLYENHKLPHNLQFNCNLGKATL